MPRYQYEIVADRLRERIRSGQYPPGEALPPRRELRAEFGVSDEVINSAMRVLRAEGLTVTLIGVAAHVANPLPPQPPGRAPS
jgi:GntR family transcriptional regulator